MTTFNQARIIFFLICAEWCIVQACKSNQYMYWCKRNNHILGALCPGVERRLCDKTKFWCACENGTAWTWDVRCVPYRDCVSRAFNPEKLLSQNEDLIMVGLSTSIFDQNTFKCIVSSLVTNKKNNFHRRVQYQKKVGHRWEKRQFDLTFYTSDQHRERLLVENEWESLPYGIEDFPTLHASEDCIILGKMPPYGEKTECTYWVRKSVVGNRKWSCDFMFDEFCKSQAIVVNHKNIITCN
ncbi:uncharacterized protein [Dermacentor andersoni]|uniref:uncharacterized protein n=1 Tax=Dermacentor andersoni TaxID=34620 RepID=UPI00241721CF|nr:uncharacterized protein LOC126533998 [Dermacentor andersoni]